MTRFIHGHEVHGVGVRERTECEHYHAKLDIIAIKFPCCNTYYPCFECHQAVADHAPEVWPANRFDERAILCGACGHELTIRAYLECESQCPACLASFNPGCANHYPLYFA